MYILVNIEKIVILSLLKSNYQCLTINPPEIANRIILSLGINPLNDFHFVSWHSFSKLHKLATLRYSKNEGRQFFISYLMTNHQNISR